MSNRDSVRSRDSDLSTDSGSETEEDNTLSKYNAQTTQAKAFYTLPLAQKENGSRLSVFSSITDAEADTDEVVNDHHTATEEQENWSQSSVGESSPTTTL